MKSYFLSTLQGFFLEARRRSVLKPLKYANCCWLDNSQDPLSDKREEKNLERDWRGSRFCNGLILMKLIQYAKSSQYGSLYRGTDGYPGIIFRSIYKPQI